MASPLPLTTPLIRPPIPSLTGLRFIAAFSVMLAHSIHWSASITHPHLLDTLLGASAGLGMPLFFVLSGFVIHYNYSHYFNKISLTAFLRFMIARFARLYPLYILLLMTFMFHKNITPWHASYLLRYLTLTQAWQFLFEGPTWIGHLYLACAWSISIEWFLYIFYALAGVYLFRFKTVPGCLIAFFIFTFIYFLAVILVFPHIDAINDWTLAKYAADVRPQSALMGWVFNIGPIGRFFEFTMGMLVAQIFLLRSNQTFSPLQYKIMNAIFYIALLGVAFFFCNPFNHSLIAFGKNVAAFMAPFLALIILLSAWRAFWFSRVLGNKVMVILGEASYSMYLLHALILPSINIGTLNEPTFHWGLVVCGSMLFIIILSLISYRFYEKPAQRFVKVHLNKGLHYIMNIYWKPLKLGKYSFSYVFMIFAALGFTCTLLIINRPDMFPQIQIIEASYGKNCETTTPKVSGFANLYHPGNATLGARQLCLHARGRCLYNVDLAHIGGDPIPGCAKDYAIQYQCQKDKTIHSVYLSGEAYGKLVTLVC